MGTFLRFVPPAKLFQNNIKAICQTHAAFIHQLDMYSILLLASISHLHACVFFLINSFKRLARELKQIYYYSTWLSPFLWTTALSVISAYCLAFFPASVLLLYLTPPNRSFRSVYEYCVALSSGCRTHKQTYYSYIYIQLT